jgi:hypothetical protein
MGIRAMTKQEIVILSGSEESSSSGLYGEKYNTYLVNAEDFFTMFRMTKMSGVV